MQGDERTRTRARVHLLQGRACARAEPLAASIWNTLERVFAGVGGARTASVFEVAGVSWVSSVSFISRFLHGARQLLPKCHWATVPSAVQRKLLRQDVHHPHLARAVIGS